MVGTRERAVKAPATKPYGLSSVPRTHTAEGEN